MASHFSLNIKTLSANINAVILSAALVRFDEKQTYEAMHISLTLEEQSQTGRHIDTERLHWWFQQMRSHHTLQAPKLRYDPKSAIKQINKFILDHGSIPPNPATPVNFIWMRGTQFDWAILENLSHACGVGLPFRHNGIRDQRTFCEEHVKHDPAKARDALYDAIYHAGQIQKTLKITGGKLE